MTAITVTKFSMKSMEETTKSSKNNGQLRILPPVKILQN